MCAGRPRNHAGEPQLRIVVVTNLWPSGRRPAWGSFVANRVDALRALGHDVDVVACEDHPSAAKRYVSLLGRTTRAAFSARRPDTVVEAHIAYPTGLFAWPVAVRLGAPLVLFAHGSDVLRLPDRSLADRGLCRSLFGTAALVVANTEYLATETTDRLGVPRDRIVVVSPGIRYADFAAEREHTGDAVRPNELLFVANLIHRKALDVLIDALAKLRAEGERPPRLRVVGDGPERAALRAQAESNGVDVDFVGALPQAAVAEEMAAARLLVVPSREEALGLVALEAMAAGCVPIVSAVGGLAETVTEGVTGFRCRAEDSGDLAEALRRARRSVADGDRLRAIQRAADAVARTHDVAAAAATTIQRYEALESSTR